jgi:tRNA(Ile)-lysidine synthase
MLARLLQELQTLAGGDALRKRYLLAVSGGADSMVMATLFHEAGLSFAIAHCNFHLRGTDSDRDMHFVQKRAEAWQVPLFIQEFDTLGIQRKSRKSVEMVARELRYKWFSEILHDFDHLVTAHHANDAAETLLLNLTRGTGLKGLCSIPPVNGKTIRPMLTFTAKEIRQYADNQHIEYIEDYTNRDEQIARNRIRHTIIPQLETLNPQFLQTNKYTRNILQRQYAYYQKHIEQDIQHLLLKKKDQYRIDRNKLADYEDKELVLYEILNPFGFATDVIEKLADRPDFQSGKQFLSESHVLLVDRDFFLIQPITDTEKQTITLSSLQELRQHFDVQEFDYQPDMSFDKNPSLLYIPKNRLTFPLQIRPWQSGDYFYPLGAKGRQKLSDFFTDHKIDRFTKERIRLLCSGNDILWIIGLRSDERFKVRENDSMCYKICIKAPTRP